MMTKVVLMKSLLLLFSLAISAVSGQLRFFKNRRRFNLLNPRPSNRIDCDTDGGATAAGQVSPGNDYLIFGRGNSNRFFSIRQFGCLEVGLRAKQRFDASSQPQDSVVSCDRTDGPDPDDSRNNVYFFDAKLLTSCFSFTNGYCGGTPEWSFDYSININRNGNCPNNVWSSFQYKICMDADPSASTDFTCYDPITPTVAQPIIDNAYGDDSTAEPTANGEFTFLTGYVTDCNILTNPGPCLQEFQNFLDGTPYTHIAQNSQNFEFYNNLGTSLANFDPTEPGTYTVCLEILRKDSVRVLAKVCIDVVTTPPSP